MPTVSILKPFTFLWISVTHLHPWLLSFLLTLNEGEMENHHYSVPWRAPSKAECFSVLGLGVMFGVCGSFVGFQFFLWRRNGAVAVHWVPRKLVAGGNMAMEAAWSVCCNCLYYH